MMRKAALVIVAMLVAVSFSGMAFAQPAAPAPEEQFQKALGAAKVMNFEGTVLSHDVACHCIVVKGAKGNLTLQDDYAKFDQDYDRAKGVQKGSKIKGTYKMVNYINYAIEVHAEK